MTGADIATIVNAAAMVAIKEQISAGKKGKLKVTMAHFEDALQKITKKEQGRLEDYQSCLATARQTSLR